jgi:predicted small secreted protein
MKAITLMAMVWFLSGCNTMQGIGKDLQQGGEAIRKAATK